MYVGVFSTDLHVVSWITLTQILLTLKITITLKHHRNSPRLPLGYPFSTPGKAQGSILTFVVLSPSRQSDVGRIQIRKLDVGGWDCGVGGE